MGVEVANYINQLVATNPLASDPKSEGDNHIRLLKAVIQATFPNIAGVVSPSHTVLNLLGQPQLCDLTSGTAPAFEIPTPQIVPSSLVQSQIYFVAFHAANSSGTATLNIASLGAKDLLEYDTTGALVAATFPSSYRGIVVYAVGSDVYLLINPTPKPPAVIVEVPPGAVMSFAMNAAPTGWLPAYGDVISRTTYSALFAAIGTTFGAGDGSTTFKLPDLRGEFIRGWDNGRGIDSGRVFGSTQSSQMQSHTHGVSVSNSSAGGTGIPPASSGSLLSYAGYTNAAGGTDNSSENRPRSIALLYCIKT
jgi:microcystin-dependent protein